MPNSLTDAPGSYWIDGSGGATETKATNFNNRELRLKPPFVDVSKAPYSGDVQAAHDALPSTGGTLYCPTGTYTPWNTATLTITKPVTILGDGSKSTIFQGPSSRDGINISGTITAYASRKLLTANAVRSPVSTTGYVPTLDIAAADITTLGIAAGDYLLVGSDQTWPGSLQTTTRGEIVQVKWVDSAANKLVLRSTLNDTYTTATGAFVLKIVFVEDVVIHGIGFDNTTPQAGQSNFVTQTMAHRCIVRNCVMKNGDGRGVWRYNCLRCGVENCHFQDFLGLGTNGSAYGVSDFNACQECWVTNCTGNRMWNLLTTNGMAQPGVPRGNVYESCTSWNHFNNAFSAHEEGEFNVYRNLKSIGGGIQEFDNGTAVTGITAVNSTDTFTKTAHGFTNGQQVRFTAKTGGSNLVVGMGYWIIGAAASTFQVARSAGGAAVDLGSDVTSVTATLIDLALGAGMSVRANNSIVQNFTSINNARTGFWYRAGLTGLMADGIIVRQQHWTAATSGPGLLIEGDSGIITGVIVDGADDQGALITGNNNYVELTAKRTGLQGTDTSTTGAAVKFGSTNGGSSNTVRLTAINCPAAVDADSGVVTGNRVIIEDLVNTPIGTTTWVQTNSLRYTVRAASVGANVNTASPGATLDGYTLVVNDKVLLKDQTAPAENGPWIWKGAAVAMVRPTDLLAKPVDALEIGVESGLQNDASVWQLNTANPIVVGTTALRFIRAYPSYRAARREPWDIGATPPIVANMARGAPDASIAQTAITAITSLHGEIVIPAGITITNINLFCTAAGAGAVTSFWFALLKLSDRSTIQRTANSTTLPTLNAVHTRALQATVTLDADTPATLAWGSQVATTSMAFAGRANVAALQNFYFQAPILQGNSSTAPTATPPAVAAVLGAPASAAATAGRVYFWLT